MRRNNVGITLKIRTRGCEPFFQYDKPLFLSGYTEREPSLFPPGFFHTLVMNLQQMLNNNQQNVTAEAILRVKCPLPG